VRPPADGHPREITVRARGAVGSPSPAGFGLADDRAVPDDERADAETLDQRDGSRPASVGVTPTVESERAVWIVQAQFDLVPRPGPVDPGRVGGVERTTDGASCVVCDDPIFTLNGVAMDEGERHQVAAGRDTSSHALIPWGYWVLRWFAAMLATIYFSLGLYLVIDAGRPITLLLLAVWLPVLALLAGGMTIVAAGLRWTLARFAPATLHHGVAVVLIGVLSGPLALVLFFATGEPGLLTAPASALEGVVAPLALGGGVAGYLAERQVSLAEPRWWLLVLAAAVAGVALGSLG
jgi:hypothetical protein